MMRNFDVYELITAGKILDELDLFLFLIRNIGSELKS
jgi:hypothetical protein